MSTLFVVLVILALLVVYYLKERGSGYTEESYQKILREAYLPYKPKQTIMSAHERLLFENLRAVLNPKYDVYPQVHLDIIFTVEYQRTYKYYLGYLRKINQKSVDYLVVDRSTQSPVFAIELDDSSHESQERMERDNFVGDVFKKANLPLVRFNPGQYSFEELKIVLGRFINSSNVTN